MILILDTERREEIKRELTQYDTSFKAKVLNFESYHLAKYHKYLRLAEYYHFKKNLIGKLLFCFYYRRLNLLSIKYNITVNLHVCSYGLQIVHIGGIRINGNARIGKNLKVFPNVIVGQTKPGMAPIIGDNVSLCAGCKVNGNIRLGNNVIVAPNAVVTHDVPDNAVVAGVPAKIIKFNL